MKVLLIYPPRQYHMFAGTLHSDALDGEVGFYPPIGLLYIASYLEKHANCEVRVVDSFTEALSHDQLKHRIMSENPDLVGIYVSTFYLFDAILVARNAKSLNKEIVVVAGGPHVSLYPMESIAIPEVDIAVQGEGEIVMDRIVKALERDRANPEVGEIAGVLTKNNRHHFTAECKIPDLDRLPFPARHLLDPTKYRSILAKHQPITTVISSRGCPYKCRFCSNLESGQPVRFRSANNVVDELSQCAEEYGIYDFLFFDELFTVNRKRVIDICHEIIRRDLKIRWHCRSRADVIDEEMIGLMRKSGCRMIQFGIETGSARLQKLIHKNLDLNKVERILKIASDHGIYTYGNFMIGLPTETPEETASTIEFAKKLSLDYAIFGVFAPMGGSEFYDQGLSEGGFQDFWREFVNNPETPIADGSWTRSDMDKYYAGISDAYRQFYLRPSYMLRRLIRTDSLSQMSWQVQSAITVFGKLYKKFKKQAK